MVPAVQQPTQDRVNEFGRLHDEVFRLVEIGANDTDDAQRIHQAMREAASFAPEMWCDIGTKLAKEKNEDLALEYFRVALSVCDNRQIRSGVFNNLGLLLANRGQMHDALASFEQARDLFPESADAYSNIALVHKWAGRLDDAERWIKRALRINPWHNDAQFIEAMTDLLKGDYPAGFKKYECRWRSKTNGLIKLEVDKPEWPGPNSGVRGKIFVYGEQGVGDIFLMLRYARLIKELGMTQAWVVKPGMKELVKTLPEIDEVVQDGDVIPEFDCHIPAASLPKAFGTTIETIPPAPYISHLPCVYAILDVKRIGIVWRGSTVQNNDRFRSTNLNQWKPVLEVPGVEFHSLQFEHSEEALAYPEIISGKKPENWLETARLMQSMDLIISVDTSVVHLAGAMGIPCWCALHCRPYFVYPITREDCPWYPSVRLFKQKREWEWEPVFERIAQELKLWIK